MRSAYLWSLMLVLTPFGVAGAQRADTSSARRDSLRHRIEERFAVAGAAGAGADQRADHQAPGHQPAVRHPAGRAPYPRKAASRGAGGAASAWCGGQSGQRRQADRRHDRAQDGRGADLARRDQGAVEVSQSGAAGPALCHAGALCPPGEGGPRAPRRDGGSGARHESTGASMGTGRAGTASGAGTRPDWTAATAAEAR